MDVGIALDERVHHFGTLVRHRPHQRGPAVFFVLGIHLRVVAKQDFHRIHSARAHAAHERRFARSRRHVGVGAMIHQRLHHCRVAVAARER